MAARVTRKLSTREKARVAPRPVELETSKRKRPGRPRKSENPMSAPVDVPAMEE